MVENIKFEKFAVELKKSLDFVKMLYEYALNNNFHNSQEFINWQDVLNVYSLLPEENVQILDKIDDVNDDCSQRQVS